MAEISFDILIKMGRRSSFKPEPTATKRQVEDKHLTRKQSTGTTL